MDHHIQRLHRLWAAGDTGAALALDRASLRAHGRTPVLDHTRARLVLALRVLAMIKVHVLLARVENALARRIALTGTGGADTDGFAEIVELWRPHERIFVHYPTGHAALINEHGTGPEFIFLGTVSVNLVAGAFQPRW